MQILFFGVTSEFCLTRGGFFFSSLLFLLLFLSVQEVGSRPLIPVPEGNKQQQAHALDLVGARQAGRKELLTSMGLQGIMHAQWKHGRL